ncbi:hypothetical protein ACFVIM_24500 [Streptomyces sp. NPDC057638]|uniref:hypothetical protein n=1 Tax=Streptomyces sp. NPDC057638 TaxID=3346190 RepID=UPI0036A1F758
MTRLWLWLTLALGAAEDRLGLGFDLLRLRWDAEAVDDWSWFLAAEARQREFDVELEQVLKKATEGGAP